MGKILVIAEKPSLGRSIAGAISWWKGEKFERQGKDRNTWLESDNYIVVSLVGHLYELIDLDAYFPGYDPAVKQPWDLKKLPFFPDDWKFKFEGKEKVQGLIKVANQQMNRKDVDAIYNAGDPDREGQRLVDEVLLYGLKAPKTIYRLWLPDTTNKTIKQAFETVKPNAGYASLSSSAETRSEMDWLLGIELTRYVSIKAGALPVSGAAYVLSYSISSNVRKPSRNLSRSRTRLFPAKKRRTVRKLNSRVNGHSRKDTRPRRRRWQMPSTKPVPQ